MVSAVAALGAAVLDGVAALGRMVRLAAMALVAVVVPPFRLRALLDQCHFVGVQSLPIVLLCSLFTGAVFTHESHYAFSLFGAQSLVGGTVGVTVTRELAPTLTALLVAGRAGSAMAAELGSMRVSEQIDALEAMAVDPVSYLIKPRLLASVLTVPLLCGVFDAVAIAGSYLVGVELLHLSAAEHTRTLQDWVDPSDLFSGIAKAVVFGFLIGVISCAQGFATAGGARGVGRSTTSAVVISSVAVLVSNYFLALVLPQD